MTARRFAAVTLALALALTGCTTPEPADVPDCDAGDRRKHETPDCGFNNRGQFVEWSWVSKGQTIAPAGWSASKEKKDVQRARKASR